MCSLFAQYDHSRENEIIFFFSSKLPDKVTNVQQPREKQFSR